ncbi:MAG: pilin [Candidatus Uhrbacteria bacterium]|nr:pilin [Candidatus Uhrbacteria bacterium]
MKATRFQRWSLVFCSVLIGALGIGIQAHAQACVNLPKVQSTCRTSPQVGEIATTGEGPEYGIFWGLLNSRNCSPSYCFVKQGDTLCAALAQKAGKTEAYSCASTCMGGELDPTEEPPGSACPSGKVCCSASGAKAAGATDAASTAPKGPTAIALPDPLSGANLPQIVGNMIRTIMGICGSIALLMFMFGGIQYIQSGGDSKKAAAAFAYIKNASLGLILIFGAYAISSIIFDALLTK